MTEEELIEALASKQRVILAGFQTFILSKGEEVFGTGNLIYRAGVVRAMEETAKTSYEEMNEEQKAACREQMVEYILPIVRQYAQEYYRKAKCEEGEVN